LFWVSSVKSILPEEPRKRGRLKLVLLALVFTLPVIASFLVWWLDLAPGAAGNYGTLLKPRPVAAAPVAALKGRWVLVQLDEGACAQACEKKLYLMRQVRRAQGRDMQRVERLWLVTDGAAPGAALRAAIEGTVIAPAGAAPAEFPAERSPRDHVYLIDPLGNLMMRFPADPDPMRVIKDLKQLLRASQFG
jgi:hypothetical protein